MPHDDGHLLDVVLELVLSLRPQNQPGHDPTCPGLTDDLRAPREACQECRDWLAGLHRGSREADREERRPRA